MKLKITALVLIVISVVFISGCATEKPDLNCENYTYSSCPEGCDKICRPSVCSPGGICTRDCDGPGSCVNPAGISRD